MNQVVNIYVSVYVCVYSFFLLIYLATKITNSKYVELNLFFQTNKFGFVSSYKLNVYRNPDIHTDTYLHNFLSGPLFV